MTKVKYVGVHFLSHSGTTEISDACRKYYGQFHNILSVLAKGSWEMSAVHLIRTYCLSTMLYGCEVWSLTDNSLHKINGAWNNCFRRIFNCCWRESVKPLQYFCKMLPLSYINDQRRLNVEDEEPVLLWIPQVRVKMQIHPTNLYTTGYC